MRLLQLTILPLALAACERAKPTAATTPRVAPPASSPCDIRVFTKPQTELSVFAAPNASQPLARLAWQEPGIIFQITEQSGERLHYRAVETLAEDTVVPPADGWIPMASVTLNLNMSEVNPELLAPTPILLRAEPTPDSPVVHTFYQEQVSNELLACRSQWVQVRVAEDGVNTLRTGWLSRGDHCGNPVSTCP